MERFTAISVQLVKLSLPVLVVPAGSGNDFARALGLAAGARFAGRMAAIHAAAQDNVRQIDLGVITSLAARTRRQLDTHNTSVAWLESGSTAKWPAAPTRLPRWLRGHGGYVLSLAPTILHFCSIPDEDPDGREDSHA